MRNTTTILKISKDFFVKNIINILFFSLAIYILTLGSNSDSSGPEIVFFDVGQGDAILIQQDDFQILVDGGPDDRILYELAKKMPKNDKTIEVVVLTHPHEDHIRGLMNVLEGYVVERLLLNRVESENKAYRYMLENYEEILMEVVKGDTVQYKDILATVLFPFDEEREVYANLNNESVVLLVEVYDYGVLLMGDGEVELEQRLLENLEIENIHILKAGHHCSKTSSSEMFLRKVNPTTAICSCGRGNRFGHPHYETLQKFEMLNVQYLITYMEGNIVIKFDDL
ncbi:MAG: MBL fold metallo-hydrolase [Candidatus Dojkabacteria bacterium]|jgi:competence protein ComEC|nr:MBL fold metallo-hydrolase [Candidatus Dojkabacteria bacterium]MDD4561419.1 MBL fold metallo-hydrolase [Candidatus Dojkabacteria bacterium]NLB11929.1 MBL fold metallo-hydrolase [Candidatus Dojkabacteria bacterium]